MPCAMNVELVVQFPARGSTQVLLCLFPGVLWLWHFLYSVDPHPVSSLHIYTFVVSRAFMTGAASQAGDADSSRAPGLTSGLQGSMNVHRGALLLVPQWQCISSFVFYMCLIILHYLTLGWKWRFFCVNETTRNAKLNWILKHLSGRNCCFDAMCLIILNYLTLGWKWRFCCVNETTRNAFSIDDSFK